MITPEVLESYKNNIKSVTFGMFEMLDKNQRLELFQIMDSQMTPDELAQHWGVSKQKVYSIRYTLRRHQEKQKNEPTKIKQSGGVQMKKESKHTPETNVFETTDVETMLKVSDKNKTTTEKQKRESIEIEKIQNNMNKQITKQQTHFSNLFENMQTKYNELAQQLQTVIQSAASTPQSQPPTKPIDHDNDGLFDFKFQGEFTSNQLISKLEKIKLLVDCDDDATFDVDFQLKEIKRINPTPNEPEIQLPSMVDMQSVIKSEMESVFKQFETMMGNYQSAIQWAEGYTTLGQRGQKLELHHPESEFKPINDKNEVKDITPEETKKAIENPPGNPGVRKINGITKYQAFYICPSCNHKGKTYVSPTDIYCNCGSCGKRMRVRESVKGQTMTADQFGNYYIAGKFLRADEKLKEQSLVEAWNIK